VIAPIKQPSEDIALCLALTLSRLLVRQGWLGDGAKCVIALTSVVPGRLGALPTDIGGGHRRLSARRAFPAARPRWFPSTQDIPAAERRGNG
jgi:hypothetical protein